MIHQVKSYMPHIPSLRYGLQPSHRPSSVSVLVLVSLITWLLTTTSSTIFTGTVIQVIVMVLHLVAIKCFLLWVCWLCWCSFLGCGVLSTCGGYECCLQRMDKYLCMRGWFLNPTRGFEIVTISLLCIVLYCRLHLYLPVPHAYTHTQTAAQTYLTPPGMHWSSASWTPSPHSWQDSPSSPSLVTSPLSSTQILSVLCAVAVGLPLSRTQMPLLSSPGSHRYDERWCTSFQVMLPPGTCIIMIYEYVPMN